MHGEATSHSRVRVSIQEFTSGGELYIGGIEAAKHASAGPKRLGINCICECRDGSSERQDRGHEPHRIVAPAGTLHIKVPASRLMHWDRRFGASITEAYTPLFEALNQGRKVLVHFKNGRHRSAQVCAAVMSAALDVDVEVACNWIWQRRRIVEWYVLSGPPS